VEVSSTPPATKRLDYLDSIRAVAAIGVVYLHGALELRSKAHGWEARVLTFFTEDLDPGKVGVLIFFMVSGFIIPSSFRFNGRRKVAVRDFLCGRIFRLYPAYWLSMLAAFVVLFHGTLAHCPVYRILLNATMFQQFVAPQQINMLGVYWTLQIEWAFYLICIGMFLVGWLRRPGRILGVYFFFLLLSLLMAVVRFKTHRALPLAATLGLSLMFAAALWRMLILERRLEVAKHVRIAFVSMAILLVPICMMAYSFDVGYGTRWDRYLFVYWLAMTIFLLMTTRLKITWAPLVAVGRASFSLYLFADIVHVLYERVFPPERYAMLSPNLYLLILIVLACLLSLPIFQYIEKPLIAIGKQVIRRYEYPDKAAIDSAAAQSM
jgi:peptidoglycan/LPS O-acetylase OafA/YrhL